MGKRGGWYRSSIRKGALPTTTLLPKTGGQYRVLVQPRSIPEHWPQAKAIFVGQVGQCVSVRRSFTPPFEAVYTLAFVDITANALEEVDDTYVEKKVPFQWDFVEWDVEEVG